MAYKKTEPKKVAIISPLRYPGSKRQLAGYIKKCLEINKIRPSLFVEPFAGGASVALQLLQENLVERIGLNDLDPWVAAFWETVFFDTDWLVEQIEKIPVTLDKWQEFKSSKPINRREQALTCLFLNRTSFSGILAPEAGPIGGKNQESVYNIGCRFPRKTLIKRIRQAEALKDRVAFVWCMHWPDVLGELSNDMQSKRIFYYFDPPFFEKADRLYRFYFQEEDHIQLRDAVLSLVDPWLLSYDNIKLVEILYGRTGKGTSRLDVVYSSSQGKNKVTQEAIITNLRFLPNQEKRWRAKVNQKRSELQISKVDLEESCLINV